MRNTIAYLTSIGVHVVAFIGLGCWLPAALNVEVDVSPGVTIVASFSPATAQAEPTPTVVVEEVDAEPLPQEDLPPVEAEMEITPAATQLTRRSSDAAEVIPIAAKPAERDETPPPQKSTSKPPKSESPPPPENVAKTPVKQAKPAPEIAQHSIAMPYQAAARSGANVDQLPRKLRSNRPPVYPPEEVQAGITGLVFVRCTVAERGNVDSAFVETSSGSQRLDEAALIAVREWQFEPAKRGGVPVAFEVIVPVRFSIR